jgi:aminotransferase
MRNPLSQKVVGIQPSGIRKFFDVVNEMKDAISLGVGEPDFDTPWRIREEGIYTLEKGRTFYTSNAGLKELKIEICKYLDRKVNVQYDYNHEVIVTVGGSEGIDIALRAMLDPGDEVLIPQPSYVSYLPCTILADGVPVVIPLQHKNEFKLTAEELEAAITPKTKILVMPFPNNPTGSIMTKAVSEKMRTVSDTPCNIFPMRTDTNSRIKTKTSCISTTTGILRKLWLRTALKRLSDMIPLTDTPA